MKKFAIQQKQPHQSKKTADHASPYISGAQKRLSPYRAAQEIQPHQQLIRLAGLPPEAPGSLLGVDAAKPALYKDGNGGGRNPAAAVL